MNELAPIDERWSLWRCACLRSAGFAARRILSLAAPALLAEGELVRAAEIRVAETRKEAAARCGELLATHADRRAIKDAQVKLFKHRVPAPLGVASIDTAVATYAAARDARARALAAFAETYARVEKEGARALLAVARDDRFRQAVAWQNRKVLASGVASLLRHGDAPRDARARSHERLLANYLQRYTTKNDTIGFYGPVGWARFDEEAPPLAQQPGAAFLARTWTFFEYWAIDALAQRIAEAPEVRRWLAPRLLPRFRLDGATLHYPIGKTLDLEPDIAAIAARCTGDVSAVALAEALGRDEAEVLAQLAELDEASIIAWTIELPTGDAWPERHLARVLASLPADASEQGRAQLAALVATRDAVNAASSSEGLEAALDELQATFERVAGVRAERLGGQMYAGRTPIYQEALRDVDVVLGPTATAKLAPLGLVLDSARWFTGEIARRYRDALLACHARHGGVVDYAALWPEIRALFPGDLSPTSIVGAVRAELHAAWDALLALDEGPRRITRTTRALHAAVRERFATDEAGWPASHHQSPDLMIAAASPEAAARGELTFVLGELHAGFNTLLGPFLKLHPSPAALVAQRDAEVTTPSIAPVWSKAVSNADYYAPSPRDFDLETADTVSARPRDHVLRAADLVVERRGDQLYVRTRDGAREFDIITFLEHHLIAESYAAFSLLPARPYQPRVAIDDLIIARETWRIATAQLAWLAIDDAAERHAAILGWAHAQGMPRWLFVRTPSEVKPVFVDLASAILVDLAVRMLRASETATVSEMVPNLDETWLSDGAETYTCELRVAATVSAVR